MKNRNSIVAEDYEEFISLTLRTRNSKKPLRMFARNWKTPMAPAMPCKIVKKNCGSGASNKITTKLACILEASESTRLRMEESLPTSLHKFIPVPQAMKIPAAKAAVDKGWEKLEKIPAWDLTKVRSKSEVIDEARTKGRKVHFASLMDICHVKNADLEAKHQKIQRSSCTPRRYCER